MGYVLIAVIGIPLFALVFSGTTLFLGLFWSRFKPEGEGGFGQLYKQFFVIAVIYVALALIGIGGWIGLAVMAVGYRTVFGAGWVEALVIGLVGGLAGWAVLIGLLYTLAQLGVSL